MNLEKLAQHIPSGELSEDHLGASDFFNLAKRFNVPININEAEHVDTSIASYLASVAIPTMEANVDHVSPLMEEIPLNLRETTDYQTSDGYPYVLDSAAMFSDPLLMTPIPDQIIPVEEENLKSSEDMMVYGPTPLQMRALQKVGASGKARSAGKANRNNKKSNKLPREVIEPPVTTVENWAQCESCKKWRRLPLSVDTEKLPDLWVCSLNIWDPLHNNCDVPEETVTELNHSEHFDTNSLAPLAPSHDLGHLPVSEPRNVSIHLPVQEHMIKQKKARLPKLSLPIRPVTTPSTGKTQLEKLMDHEVVELLLADNGDHPLRDRLTLNSLDRASLLATELPHDVLLLGNVPLKKRLKENENFINGAGYLINPDEDLLKDDPSFKDDGTLSIGIARKTQWGIRDQDASTVDSMESLYPGVEPVFRSTLAELFPKLARQLPAYKPLDAPNPSQLAIKREQPSTKGRKAQQNEALSAMNRYDLMDVLSLFTSTQMKSEAEVPRKHCQLEEKISASTLPLDSFLKPLSMLALPLPYVNASDHVTEDESEDYQPPLSPEDLKTDSPVDNDFSSGNVISVALKNESRRRVPVYTTPVKIQADLYNDKEITKMREEYVRRSVGKSYFKKLKTEHPDIDYPAPDCKRLSRRIATRYAQEDPSRMIQEDTQDDTQDEMSLDNSYDMGPALAYTAALQAAAIPEGIGLNGHDTASPYHRDVESLFGIDMSQAIDLLNSPIALDSNLPHMRNGTEATHRQGVVCGLAKQVAVRSKRANKKSNKSEILGQEINMDIYKNPRLLTEV
ncbi:hypothetical protein BgAZ_109140 [Babesia gibsoni]|uniref:CW-type domain-containing protein n=1 Tax=Babesia gibsoni TaxID=33632 RepID=A0AAD8PGT9_BABGI|nr:hypothetical protein BgAZ_109140 [Babesia gibsoni]